MQPAAGLELVTRCSRRDLPRRWRGLPGSWRTPVSVPCSSTPAGSRTPGHCGVAMRPSVNCTTSAPASRISGLNRTARSLAVYASQPGSPRHHARLAPGRWPGSTGRGWLPAGSQRKVSACGFPLSQAFLAHAVVLGEEDLSLAESERLGVSLRIDVRPLRREAVPEVVGFPGRVRG